MLNRNAVQMRKGISEIEFWYF